MRVADGLLWVAFAAIWLLVLIVGLVTALDGGYGFWNGIHQEHHVLLKTAFFLTGARAVWSYRNWKARHESTR